MKWFKEVFLPSFKNCEGKRVSEKQGEIFKRYLDFEKEQFNAEYYTKEIGEKIITLQVSSAFSGCHYNKTGRHTDYRTEYYITIKNA